MTKNTQIWKLVYGPSNFTSTPVIEHSWHREERKRENKKTRNFLMVMCPWANEVDNAEPMAKVSSLCSPLGLFIQEHYPCKRYRTWVLWHDTYARHQLRLPSGHWTCDLVVLYFRQHHTLSCLYLSYYGNAFKWVGWPDGVSTVDQSTRASTWWLSYPHYSDNNVVMMVCRDVAASLFPLLIGACYHGFQLSTSSPLQAYKLA